MTSARLKLLGTTPFARETFTSLVITGTNVVMCLLRMSVGIGSKLHDFVVDFMMTLCISSSLASLKVAKACFTAGGCDSNRGGEVTIRLSKSLRIFSIRSIHKMNLQCSLQQAEMTSDCGQVGHP